MSRRRFFLCLGVIVAAGVAWRTLDTPALPDLPVDEYIRRGEALQKQGQIEEAIRYHSAALAKEPRNVHALTSRAAAYIDVPDGASAFTDLGNAIHFSKGRYRDSFVLRAYMYHLAGAFDLALADINHAIALDEKHPDGYLLRAMIYQHPQKGDEAKSRADHEKGRSLVPAFKERLTQLGERGV